jgi:hypothetical protein
LLVWEHAASDIGGKTFEERAADADNFLKRYTSWANGEGWCYRIEDGGEIVDTCGGFDDAAHMLDNIAAMIDGREFEVRGDASYLERQVRDKVAATPPS